MKRIPLRRRDGSVRAYALVDDEDFELISGLRWCLHNSGYACREVPTVMMHRLILGLTRADKRQADHINRNRLDNRRANLRVVEAKEQAQNASLRRDNTSGYRGVVKHKDKWEAYAKRGKKRIYIGLFVTPKEADIAAKSWREKHLPLSDNAASVAATLPATV